MSSTGDAPSEVAGEPPGDVAADPSLIQYRNQETLTRELAMAGKIQIQLPAGRAARHPRLGHRRPARTGAGDLRGLLRFHPADRPQVGDRGRGRHRQSVRRRRRFARFWSAFTSRFPTLPGLALKAVSDRILSDTGGSMFVTALFGIRNLIRRFIYANAGHPPGYLVSGQRGRRTIETLRSTGMALGVIEDAQWKQKVVKLGPGDVLVLYSDGVIEAEDAQGESFGDERLLDVVLDNSGCSSREIQEALLNEVHRFSGNALRQDDIALIVIKRDGS